MNLDSLKDKLTEAEFTQLQAYVQTLASQKDEARAESISGRKTLKAEVENLRKVKEMLYDKLGLESDADPSEVEVPTKGQELEAVKQAERRLKKLEAELAVTAADKAALDTKYKSTLTEAALRKAISQHEFIDADLVAEYVKGRVKFENDELVYQEGDKVLSVDEGVKLFATTKPHMLKSQGQGGSGFNPNSASGKTKAFSEMSMLEKNELYKANPEQYKMMKGGLEAR